MQVLRRPAETTTQSGHSSSEFAVMHNRSDGVAGYNPRAGGRDETARFIKVIARPAAASRGACAEHWTDKPASISRSRPDSFKRRSPAGARRPRCSPRTRPGGSRPMWRSCRSYCGRSSPRQASRPRACFGGNASSLVNRRSTGSNGRAYAYKQSARCLRSRWSIATIG
jgi:hypothetical protein